MTASLLIVLAAVMPGCGDQRTQPPELLLVGGNAKTIAWKNEGGGLALRYPASWTLTSGKPPSLVTITTGGAIATIYAYPRDDLGTDQASVEAQRKRIVDSLQLRAPGFKRFATPITTVDGSPAVEVLGRGLINDRVVRARSVHVFKPNVEWVVDAYAVPSEFRRANRVGFGPILRSLKLADAVHANGGGGGGEDGGDDGA